MKNLLSFVVLSGLALSMALTTGCASTIEPGNVGVKVVMGKADKNLVDNGFYWFNPLTDSISEYSLKTRTVTGSSTPLTSDQQPITIDYKVQYSIPRDSVLDLFQNVQGDPYAVLIAPQVQEAFRQVISQYKADQVTSGVNSMAAKVLDQVRSNTNGRVTISAIPITHVGLPEAIQQAIMEKQKIEVEAKKKQFELVRERTEAEIVVTKAKASAEELRLRNAALKQSPELVKYKLADAELVKAQKWNGQLPTTLITQPGTMPFMQLGGVK